MVPLVDGVLDGWMDEWMDRVTFRPKVMTWKIDTLNSAGQPSTGYIV